MPATVQLSTFKSWNVDKSFGYTTFTREDGKEMIKKLWCKTCSKYVDKILASPSLRGKAKSEVKTYVQGTEYVSKHTVFRHLEAKVSELILSN